jgi:hypothetical protein
MFPRAVRRLESHEQKKQSWERIPKRQIDKQKADESELTFDLLLLPLEGLARLLGLALQVKDRGLLLLKGLAQIFVRNADLDQLPVDLQHLVLPLLEGVQRPLEHGALLLELTQSLLPRQALPLERGPGLGESSLLLLEPGLRLLARRPFLTELLLHRDERGSLARQGRPQPLRLLGLFLGLALPGPRPLEGRAVLLELGAGGGDLGPHTAATERPPARSSRALRNASSGSTSAVLNLSTAEAPPAAWAPCSRGRSNRASALYASHRSGDLRASTRATRASYYPRYQ